jgi:hypothetical protein
VERSPLLAETEQVKAIFHRIAYSEKKSESTAKTLKFHHEDTKSQSSLFNARVSVSLWFDFCLFAVDSKVIAYLSDEELSHTLVIASVAKQSPGRYGDCFAACGGSQCNGRKFSTATTKIFYRNNDGSGGWLLSFSEFPEGKIHYRERYTTSPTNRDRL